MDSLVTIIAIIMLPVGILNFAGGIVASIWLLVIGKWGLVLSALISTVFSTWILGFLMAPTLLFMAPLAWEPIRKRRSLVFLLGALSNLWTYALMFIYGVGSFIFVFNNYESGIILPYLLLAYSVSTAPWTYMASAESRSTEGAGLGTTIPVFAVCVSAIAMMSVVVFYGNPTLVILATACAIPLILGWAVQMVVAFYISKVIPQEL